MGTCKNEIKALSIDGFASVASPTVILANHLQLAGIHFRYAHINLMYLGMCIQCHKDKQKVKARVQICPAARHHKAIDTNTKQ